MKILVTGHLGYIGAVLTPKLLDRGHTVVGFDTDLYRACTFAGSLVQVPMIDKDIREADVDDVRGFDAIIHLAALSNDPLGDFDPALTQEINCKAAIRLAQLAKSAGVPRFLFASTCANYGASGVDFLDESATFNPVRPYGMSKASAERAIALMADETFSPTFLRASTAYGLSPRIRFDLVVNNLTAWAFATGQVYLKSDGSAWRPIVHVDDISSAYVAAVEADRDLIHNQAFNVGSTTENYQIHEIAAIVATIVPKCAVVFAPDAAADLRCYRVDCNHIGRRLHGFKPQWTARRGIEELYDAYCRTGLTLADFEGERFRRISHVEMLIRSGEIDRDFRRVTQQPTAVAA